MGQEESWMEMFKKFGTDQAHVLVALPSPCTSPVPLFPSVLLSSCTRLAHMDTMLLYWLHLFSLHRVPRRTSPQLSRTKLCLFLCSFTIALHEGSPRFQNTRPLSRLWAVASRVFSFVGVCCSCSLSLLGSIISVFSFSWLIWLRIFSLNYPISSILLFLFCVVFVVDFLVFISVIPNPDFGYLF